MDKTEITNQDYVSKKSATAGGVFAEKTTNSTESIPSADTDVIDVKNESENVSDSYSPKPVDIAKQKYYES